MLQERVSRASSCNVCSKGGDCKHKDPSLNDGVTSDGGVMAERPGMGTVMIQTVAQI
jgi:hypothetical protein